MQWGETEQGGVHVNTEPAVKQLCVLDNLTTHGPHHIRDFDSSIASLPKMTKVSG